MPYAPRRSRRSFAPRPHNWWGYDYDTTCNLCGIWRPSERNDERLLALPTFEEFAWTASLYRDREQGRVLVRECPLLEERFRRQEELPPDALVGNGLERQPSTR